MAMMNAYSSNVFSRSHRAKPYHLDLVSYDASFDSWNMGNKSQPNRLGQVLPAALSATIGGLEETKSTWSYLARWRWTLHAAA